LAANRRQSALRDQCNDRRGAKRPARPLQHAPNPITSFAEAQAAGRLTPGLEVITHPALLVVMKLLRADHAYRR
jgi:hypothetical protein